MMSNKFEYGSASIGSSKPITVAASPNAWSENHFKRDFYLLRRRVGKWKPVDQRRKVIWHAIRAGLSLGPRRDVSARARRVLEQRHRKASRMGIASENRPKPYRLNPNDIHALCPGCGVEKIITQRAIEDLAAPLSCHRCGGTVWVDVTDVKGERWPLGRIVFGYERQ
jgi:hypothetical protein